MERTAVNGQDVKGMAKDARETLHQGAKVVRDRLEDTAGDINAQFQDVRERGMKAIDASTDYIKTNPWGVVLGAAAVGLVAGMLLRGRNK